MNLNQKLSNIAEIEFSDIVEFAEDLEEKLRIYIRDGSYIDVWFSRKVEERHAYHRERRHVDGTVYRHDNIPHGKWNYAKTFPKHFHNGSEYDVCDSSISDEPVEAIREFLSFVRDIIDN